MEIQHPQNKRWKMLRTLASKLDELEADERITITSITITPIDKPDPLPPHKRDFSVTILYEKPKTSAAAGINMASAMQLPLGIDLEHRDDCTWDRPI
jgi:hypothetical protein